MRAGFSGDECSSISASGCTFRSGLLIHEEIFLRGASRRPRFLIQSVPVFTDLPTGAPDDSTLESIFSLKLSRAKYLDGTGESLRLVGATDGGGRMVRARVGDLACF